MSKVQLVQQFYREGLVKGRKGFELQKEISEAFNLARSTVLHYLYAFPHGAYHHKNKSTEKTEEIQSLRMQKVSPSKISEKLGIKKSKVSYHLYLKKHGEYPLLPLIPSKYGARHYAEQVRTQVHEELEDNKLPLEWEDELVKMFFAYKFSDEKNRRGIDSIIDVRSLIVLLCRRYKVPTPRTLAVKTYQGGGKGGHGLKQRSGYMDALSAMNGVKVSKPFDYVQFFAGRENLGAEKLELAQEIISGLPMAVLQSRNPRVLAGATIYEVFRRVKDEKYSRLYTQRYIADVLSVTEVALRKNWHELFAKS